jgi:hypothetical protein
MNSMNLPMFVNQPNNDLIHPTRIRRRPPGLDEYEVYNISIKEALLDSPDLVHQAIAAELQQMIDKKVFHPVSSSPIKPIPSKLYLKKKLDRKVTSSSGRLAWLQGATGKSQMKLF